MLTPNGVNYLLQFLVISSNSPIIRNKNQKWTSSLMSLYLLSLHTHTPLVITLCFLEAAVRTESDANLRKVFDFKYFLLVFQQKNFRIDCRFKKMHYLCIDKSRPLPIRTAYPAGHFLYIDVLKFNKLMVRCFWRYFDIILYLCSSKRRNHEENDDI